MLKRFEAEKSIEDKYRNIGLNVKNQLRGAEMQELAGQILQSKPDLTACVSYANNILDFNNQLELFIDLESSVSAGNFALNFLMEKLKGYKQDPAKPEYIDLKVFTKVIMTLQMHFAKLASAEKAVKAAPALK